MIVEPAAGQPVVASGASRWRGLWEAAASVIPPEGRGEWDRDVAPNLAPLDCVVVVTRVEGDAWISRLAIVLK